MSMNIKTDPTSFGPCGADTLIRCPIARDVWVDVRTIGQPDVDALDKLIEILVMTRNNWRDAERECRQ